MPQNNRQVGNAWEEAVTDYLRSIGYTILRRNYRTRYSEIDIIAQDSEELVFIEVKYRKDGRSGSPLEAVNAAKQKRITNAAIYYLSENNYSIDNTAIRFDVVGVCGENIEHIRNAF